MTTLSIRQQLIKRIRRISETQLAKGDAETFQRFVEQVVHVHPDDDQLGWEAEANFGVLHGLFRFVSRRADDQPLLRVFNPNVERDGWSSKHSVIYYCHRDMPFLVDSLRMALNRVGINIYLFESSVLWSERDDSGELVACGGKQRDGAERESIGYVMIDRCSDADQLADIARVLGDSLTDVGLTVGDFQPMLERLDTCIEQVAGLGDDHAEEVAFLRWLRDGNFTFLGMAAFNLEEGSSGTIISEDGAARLGLMKKRAPLEPALLTALGDGFVHFYHAAPALAFTKTAQKSTVHRAVYADYIIIKRYGTDGAVIGETRVLGLYTSGMYFQSIDRIPLLRAKSQWLEAHSQLDNASHNGKTFKAIIERHPRDEMIQATNEELLETLLGIWKIYERRAVRLFVRVDAFEKFVSCIVYLPREAVRLESQIEQVLGSALQSSDCDITTQFMAESVLARVHLIYRVSGRGVKTLDREALEDEIRELTRDWRQRFGEICVERFGEERGRQLAHRYRQAFPSAYQDRFTPMLGVNDMELCQQLRDRSDISISLFQEVGADHKRLRLKLFQREESLQLSDVMPVLENMGSRVLVEHPFHISPQGESDIWMHDFSLEHELGSGMAPNIEVVGETYQDALRAIWRGQAENDTFNRLVFGARLDWRAVALIRAYARYLKQLGSLFSMEFVASVLCAHVEICRDLMALFRCLFDPRRGETKQSGDRVEKIRQRILDGLDQVQNLNEDQVLRQYLAAIDATLRTNYFQTDEAGNYRECIALKINTRKLDFAPEPRPEFEIYVFSPRVEGVHLRGGKVARGGIRWSDRLEDFRTEILGLVKAQQVKNAVIVPTGAKGGFVARRAASFATREELQAEGIACYRLFIGSLLDITDNRVGNKVVRPEGVVCRDDEDPYLVVAADKGTATFSDTANEIAAQHQFWLGDAFASGGSNGYDHKAMGITARGAWVAVQRHFRELGMNVQEEDFTVVGIGDMAGDVFGNGMLLSRHIKLVGAFNHQHIFIDPTPDPEAAWQERKRLFDQPRSSWADYNADLISKGGGVFERSAKQIPLSAAMRKLLDCKHKSLAPNELIKLLLKAEVDLIWNGGIGTYVKASSESNSDVGDRSNDALRVNGRDLRCRVVGEGGNLGLTQLGRMEYCRHGGICNTDFVDNAAGVDCSDHEVNIKILLNTKVESQDLTAKQRNKLLANMTDAVGELVLENNSSQTLAISLAQFRRRKHHYDYLRFLEHLEESGRLQRALEYLPDNDTIKDLHGEGKSWTRPELAVLVSYAKVELKEQLLEADLSADDWVAKRVFNAFPAALHKTYGNDIRGHRLAKEIIATQLANDMVNMMGFSYSLRQNISVGASAAQTAMAFVTVMELFDLGALWREVEGLDYQVDSAVQYELFHQIMRLGRRSTRWFLRNKHDFSPQQSVSRMKPDFERVMPKITEIQGKGLGALWRLQVAQWTQAKVPDDLASRIAAFDAYFLLPGAIDAAKNSDCDAESMTALLFSVVDSLSLDWILERLIEWQPDSRWQDLARESYVDNLEILLRKLIVGLQQHSDHCNADILSQWRDANRQRIERYLSMTNSLRATATQDLSVFTVIERELQDLVEASLANLSAAKAG
ncbi:NAD-glutamate dehydrogenase [Spongiibacter taiwanensis]|uniref:NAD-glutamate dehydrogenase n=1 Tax=Spongiibacter taiwanensis TaxID=1748242 RepID=UPI0020357EF1|nr:NAD-glutamate dehydrogenase [Spongiibacter taiwanensis]USA42337.1 NAD-glutamate dehydrogenase [Spongiibacter taiwanensis]